MPNHLNHYVDMYVNLTTVEDFSGAEASDGCHENSGAQNAARAAVALFLPI
jgi:hypothetical protein